MRFVLVHGTSFGAWCWRDVIPELERLGHAAIAIDLPGHGERVDELAPSFAARSLAINAVLQPGDVLVGHSAGGYDITIAADRDPQRVGHLIYLAAGLPVEGRSIGDAMHGVCERDADGAPMVVRPDPAVLRHAGQDADGRMVWLTPEGLGAFCCHDGDAATLAWAFARHTPAAPVAFEEVISVPAFWRAELPRSFILCTEDRVLPPPRAQLFCERLGVAPLTIAASHSPMLSRPKELADLLVAAAATRPHGPLLAQCPEVAARP